MSSGWEETLAARKSVLWMVAAFGGGLLLGMLGRPQPAPGPRPAWPAGPVAIVTPPLVNPTPQPSPPAAVAKGTASARIVIERPVYPPGWGSRVPQAHDGLDQAPVLDHTQPTPGVERIVIETQGGGEAVAPIVTPPPPTPAPQLIDPGPGVIGVTIGGFPGRFALSYEPVRADLFGLVTVGPSAIVNANHIGLGGAFTLPRFNPRLYCEVGYGQEFKLVPNPQPYGGVGWRF